MSDLVFHRDTLQGPLMCLLTDICCFCLGRIFHNIESQYLHIKKKKILETYYVDINKYIDMNVYFLNFRNGTHGCSLDRRCSGVVNKSLP